MTGRICRRGNMLGCFASGSVRSAQRSAAMARTRCGGPRSRRSIRRPATYVLCNCSSVIRRWTAPFDTSGSRWMTRWPSQRPSIFDCRSGLQASNIFEGPPSWAARGTKLPFARVLEDDARSRPIGAAGRKTDDWQRSGLTFERYCHLIRSAQ